MRRMGMGMGNGSKCVAWWHWIVATAACVACACALAIAADAPIPATTARVATTQAATTQSDDLGPDVVLMKELVALYEPVPFEHKSHARMAEMWDGCTTCHHRPPQPTTGPTTNVAATLAVTGITQEASAAIPACKSCHQIAEDSPDLRVPNLKAAYHRQCLGCHRDWMHGNACVICHKPLDGTPQQAQIVPPTPGDITGRMHPPIPEPDLVTYKTRFTPAVGSYVLFRHKEHTVELGLRCATCHRRDNCAHCHDPQADTTSQKPLQPGRTWRESHGPCISCHEQDRCRHCHYHEDESPPPRFDHRSTGQAFDADHATLACGQCHAKLKAQMPPTCGDSNCHKDSTQLISFPTHRPGPLVPKPATQKTAMPASHPTTLQATTTTVTKIRHQHAHDEATR